jgi:hypothetical protein
MASHVMALIDEEAIPDLPDSLPTSLVQRESA